jgi:hypothetical protein
MLPVWTPTALANSDNTRTALVQRPYGSQPTVESALRCQLKPTRWIVKEGGMVRVKDEVTIEFDIAADR